VRGTLAVIAKAPVAGRSKTRLCPPCTPAQAAGLAEAALRDTLAAVRATPCARRVLVLDGDPGAWLPPGFELVAQRGDGLDERLACAFDDLDGEAFLVGMDTPQITPTLLGAGLDALADHDAALGPALDGGYWGIGLGPRACRGDLLRNVFVGVPMSEEDTGAQQLRRLRVLGLSVDRLPALRDVDHIEDAHAVAAQIPGSRFAAAVAALDDRHGRAAA
jgi:rSAM/selenodomain-associated transferase 1